MLLRDLVGADEILWCHGPMDALVRHIVTDSREVGPGDLFVCLPGYRTEGGELRADRHDFIPMAIESGARALLVDRRIEPPAGVTVVQVGDCWTAAAEAACRYYGHPSRDLVVVGVTGTSGKTSTSYFMEAVLKAAGHTVARIGTIEYRLGDTVLPAAQTTPEAPILQGLLRNAVERGCTAAVMEVSSHALELRRTHGIEFDAAVFTNLSHDHLNFHANMEHYIRAKARLFEALATGTKRGCAVVNVDDPASERMVRSSPGPLCTFGVGSRPDVSAREVTATLNGLVFRLRTPRGERTVALRHLGAYSVYNALAAAATAHALGVDLDAIERGLRATPPVPGRFELIDAGQDFVVVIDYAHKPDALGRLLDSARELGPARIITVFGCGGDRDRAKRPIMGRIALERSDLVVVTSDNPRSEPSQAIIDEILGGMRALDPRAERYVVEPDRAAAIRRAIRMAGAGDMIIVAGKGHETYQLIAGRRIDFDDRLQARQALAERTGDRRAS